MLTQAVLVSILVALSEARFGQEQIPIAAIAAVQGGSPGQAATLAGQSVSFLLAAANPCGKLQQADLIVATLGTGADSIAAARGLVAAEQNFNPSVVDVPSICSDPTLPTTEALRGVIPLVDPAVGDSALENTNSATSLLTPFNATGLSVGDIMVAQGFSNFTVEAVDGTKANPPVSGQTVPVTNQTAPSNSSALAIRAVKAPAANSTTAAAGTSSGVVASSIAGLDFGLCTPTIKFEAGLDGRSDTEFTFQAIDPLVNKGQEEALNPNIITKRICDQLTNVCNANAAAKAACTAAQAQILALGTRDVTTADAWNTALGFAGTNTNPDNAPQAGLIGHD
ncbi:hypothetical protein B7494_g4022 [Chlorociboria aeruginascens]|nr:hypothetical protein B7494_g4022 [Chlorociboria aeruginascens]